MVQIEFANFHLNFVYILLAHFVTLAGVKIYSPDEALNGMLDKKHIKEIIISIHNINPQRKADIVNFCLEKEIEVKNVPPIV